MNTTSNWLAIVAVAFVAGSFIASPELRAFAANTVRSLDIADGEVKTADLANNAVTAAKIKDNEVKAAEIAPNAVGASEIATDAVGAAEIIGVTKLTFAQCRADATEGNTMVDAGKQLGVSCSINGVDTDDSAIVSMNTGNVCFDTMKSEVNISGVFIILENECSSTQSLNQAHFGVLVYDK
jgi:hypothetical protein